MLMAADTVILMSLRMTVDRWVLIVRSINVVTMVALSLLDCFNSSLRLVFVSYLCLCLGHMYSEITNIRVIQIDVGIEPYFKA